MVKLSSEQKTKVVQFYIQTGSIIETKRTARYSVPETPYHLALSPVSLRISSKPAQLRSSLEMGENQSLLKTKSQVSGNRGKIPTLSIRCLAQQVNLSRSATQSILRKELKLHPYKIPDVQALSPEAHMKHKAFSECFFCEVRRHSHFSV